MNLGEGSQGINNLNFVPASQYVIHLKKPTINIAKLIKKNI